MNKTAIKERPILFNVEMVRAILSGLKTQTRRLIKSQPAHGCQYNINGNKDKAIHWNGDKENPIYVPVRATSADTFWKSPFGKPGDQLWVRETFYICPNNRFSTPHYCADGPLPSLSERHDVGLLKKYPSIHMPRWASRIQLEVTDIRVERLQEITEEDAVAEGINMKIPLKPHQTGMGATHPSAVFSELWNSINVKPESCWEANPYVWVVEFKSINPNLTKRGKQ